MCYTVVATVEQRYSLSFACGMPQDSIRDNIRRNVSFSGFAQDETTNLDSFLLSLFEQKEAKKSESVSALECSQTV
jgi:hypothetical protein